MPMFPTSDDTFDPLDPEGVKRRRANTAQAATNSTPLSQMAQQFSQPAGGNFQAAPPEPVSPLKGLVGGLARQPGASPTPAAWQQGAQQSYQDGTAAGRDMSWMKAPGALQGPQGAASLGATPAAPQTALPGTFRPTPAPTPSDLTTQPVPSSGAPTAPSAANTSAYKTNGYNAPALVVAGSASAPAGWDGAKWADPNHQTPKYGVGRVLSQFPATVEGLTQAMPDIQKAYPGSRLIGRDKVEIPGVGVIDVLQGSAEGGKAWQWLDEAAAAGGPTEPPMAEGAGAAAPGAGAVDPFTGAGAVELDPITGLPVPRSASPDLQALLSQLMQGGR